EGKALKPNPRNNTYRQFLFNHLSYLTDILMAREEYAQADRWYPELVDLCKGRHADAPEDPAFRQDLAAAYQNWGLALMELGKLPRARNVIGEAPPLYRGLMDEFPKVARHPKALAPSYPPLPGLLARTPDPP